MFAPTFIAFPIVVKYPLLLLLGIPIFLATLFLGVCFELTVWEPHIEPCLLGIKGRIKP